MKVNGLPFIADTFENQCHAAGVGFGFAIERHRLRPEARHHRAVATQHRDVPLFDVELHILALRE